MSKKKGNLSRIITVIPKKKWVYFGILSVLLIFFSGEAIRYSDIPMWPNMWKYFIKPQNADMLLYDLSVGYIGSYMFYLLVDFIPDWFEAIEKEKENIPIRCCVYRELQVFISRIISLWCSIEHVAVENNVANGSNITDIRSVFNREFIQQRVACVNLSQSSNTISFNSIYVDWYTKIFSELTTIINQGNLITTRYKYDMPTKIFYDMFYLVNDSNMLGNLPMILNAITSSKRSKNILLAECMNFQNGTGGEDIDKSCEAIINLYNWTNIEYNYLIENIDNQDIRIHNTEFSTYV